jgi:hypothetical protein
VWIERAKKFFRHPKTMAVLHLYMLMTHTFALDLKRSVPDHINDQQRAGGSSSNYKRSSGTGVEKMQEKRQDTSLAHNTPLAACVGGILTNVKSTSPTNLRSSPSTAAVMISTGDTAALSAPARKETQRQTVFFVAGRRSARTFKPSGKEYEEEGKEGEEEEETRPRYRKKTYERGRRWRSGCRRATAKAVARNI